MSLKITLIRLYPHLTEDNIRTCNLVNYTVEVHNKTTHFFSLSVCVSHSHKSTRAHTRLHSPSSLSLPPNGLKSSSDWVALRIRGQGRCLTPYQTCQNLSCLSQRRNFWIALDEVHLEMTKQGAKNDNFTSLISLLRRWYLDGMGTKMKLFSYNNKANLRDSLTVTSPVIFKSSIFQPVWPWNLMDDLEKQ